MKRRNGMRPVHPGEILKEEMEELEMSARALAEAISVPSNRVSSIINGTRGITADTALRLSRYLGTSPEMWMNLQKTYELRSAEIEAGREIEKQIKPRPKAA